jgi:hypothetical protein
MVCKPFGFEQKQELINNRKPEISQINVIAVIKAQEKTCAFYLFKLPEQ